MVDITILIIFMSGVGLGCVGMMNWSGAHRQAFKEAIHADLTALRTSHRLSAEAWQAREQMHEAAVAARSQGEQS